MGAHRLHEHEHARPQAAFLQTGALLSVLSCTTIVVSYARRRRWRRHPNALLFWKAAIDLVYALRFLYIWDALVGAFACRALASLSQFCLFASECWFVNMSLDLYRCSTNPFTNVKHSLRWYHAFAWGTGALVAVALWCANPTFRTDSDPFCYVSDRDTAFELLYYAVVVLSVVTAIGLAVLENRAYPHGGMQGALEAKKDVIQSARVFTSVYILYQIGLISLWIADRLLVRIHPHARVDVIRNGTFFVQTSKGLIDLVIWIVMNSKALRRSAVPLPRQSLSEDSHSQSRSRADRFSDVNIDLEPQLNAELRKEVLHFTTRGVVAASANTRRSSAKRRVVRLRLHELGMVVAFNDFSPAVFREIRRGFGIDESAYRKSFSATCHERIASGGSSGAFMFFTADYMYLVKTVTPTERNVLLRMLPAYVAHMRAHPGSHLTRYYGCHAIEMYGQSFSFVVMGNVIGRMSMHQFYDLKGSWINRNAKPIPPGKTVICTYCSNAFHFGSTAHCEYSIHGSHLPHVVLKDNDFHRKLRILPEIAEEIVEQLDADTVFLHAQGITDYSLLLSIHSTKYVVDYTSRDIDTEASERTKRRVNYAVCHPEDRDDCGDLKVNVELVDGTDSGSSDEEENDKAAPELEVTTPLETGRRGFLSRQFRYSVLTAHDDGDEASTPLLPRSMESIPMYSSQSPRDAVAVAVTDQNQSQSHEWIGARAPDKPGYEAYAVIGPDYYTIGVVDILQTWTLGKRLERLWKVVVRRFDPDGISAAPPQQYADRFRRKMREIMMVPNNDVGFGHQ